MAISKLHVGLFVVILVCILGFLGWRYYKLKTQNKRLGAQLHVVAPYHAGPLPENPVSHQPAPAPAPKVIAPTASEPKAQDAPPVPKVSLPVSLLPAMKESEIPPFTDSTTSEDEEEGGFPPVVQVPTSVGPPVAPPSSPIPSIFSPATIQKRGGVEEQQKVEQQKVEQQKVEVEQMVEVEKVEEKVETTAETQGDEEIEEPVVAITRRRKQPAKRK